MILPVGTGAEIAAQRSRWEEREERKGERRDRREREREREDHIAMRPLVRKCDALTLIESCVLPRPPLLLLHG